MSNVRIKVTKVSFEEQNLPEKVKTRIEKEYKKLMKKWNNLFGDYDVYSAGKQEELDIINARYGSSVILQWADKTFPIGVFTYRGESRVIYTIKVKCKAKGD